MEIVLKNGEKLKLDMNSLILEYLEDYKGGIEQLRLDAQGQKDSEGYTRKMYATNQLVYAVIAANYDRPLSYRSAIRLVNIEDVEKIADFIIEKLPSVSTNIESLNKHRMN